MYFYLDDNPENKDYVYSEAIDLMTDLRQAGLRVEFYSKEQAFDLLSKRLPDVMQDLDKFGIENPLPPTLYVMFRTQTEYNYLKSALLKYEGILENLDDFQRGVTFGEQEQRVATVINLMNTIQIGSYALIAIVITIIVAFLRYAIEINFLRFQKQIELEKLLGAPYWKIAAPFLLYIASTLL
ncbi:MAG: hypothetical protein H6765_06775 [Candidatus Peribacteria bacterium]|nr:MAG: hypothetical protein H6765_06775 [Candidatus Peribacteria bacterium]